MIRTQLLNQIPMICIQRAEIVTEAYQHFEACPVIEKRAHALAAVLRKMSIYIDDGELIVGNQASCPRAAPLFPEYAYEFILDELDSFENRSSDRFIIDEGKKETLRKILPWWHGKTLRDRALARQSQAVLDDVKIGVLGWQGNVSSGEGHIIPDYETILRLGFTGLQARTAEKIANLDLAEPRDLEKLSFYRACSAVLDGVFRYIHRFEMLASEQAENCTDPDRAGELLNLSRCCHDLISRPPETFTEALQCIWFVQVILHIESNGHSLSLGRFDQYLFPFYQNDIEQGILTSERAYELLGCFYLKLFGNNKLRSWGTTQTQLGYPTYQNICLGGQLADKQDATNALSYLCLDALDEIHLPEPNIYIRVHPGTPQAFLKRAIKIVKAGVGMPSFVNDQVIIPALEKRGIPSSDALNYSTMGCTEVQVPGKWGYRANGKSKINLLRILEIVLNGGIDAKTGIRVIKGLQPLRECTSFDEIEAGYHKAIDYYMRLHVIADNTNEIAMAEMVPDAFCSMLMQDCLGRGQAIKDGGTVYDMVSGTLVGIPNIGNALYAIKTIVFDKKRISPDELQDALATDFSSKKGRSIQALLENAPKYGNDLPEVDELTRRTSDYYTQQIYNYKTMRNGKGPIGCCYTSSTVTITANIPCGAAVGATPDGRRAGAPTAEGVSPARGTLKNGLTAVFKSVGRLSNDLFTGGQLLNVRINPDTLVSEAEEDKFAAILRTAGDLKCWHSQYNVLSDETLRDAQAHPENYKDLMVRVAGYSALFTSLNPELQEDIIARTQFNL